jgi:cysteine-rich repeat protein
VDTSTGTAALSAYPSCDNVGFQFPSAESVFRFAPALFTRATFTVRRTGTGATTWILFALDGNDAGCGGGLPCLGQADDYDPTLNLAVHGGNLVFLSYDARVTSGASTTMTLEVTCTVTQCGDGEVGEGETCDDDETEDLDGCSGTCQVEEGWACSGTPSTCREVTCGDGFIDAPEECDDDEDERGDGCDDDCHVEDGWECTGEPSTCTQTRGDTCADAPTVSAPTTLSGSTESYSADVSEWLGTCRVNYAARDRFYKVAVPTGKVLYAHVATPADYPSLRLLLSASCPDSAATCFHEAPASSLRWLNNTGVTRNVYLALDSMLANDQGSYALSVEFEDPASYAAGHTCLHAQRLSTAESGGTQTVSGNTTASLDYYHGYLGDCATAHYGLPGLAGGPELVYVVNVPAGKQLLVNSSATWDHVVAIADNCADLQASCRSWKDSGDPSVRNGSGADKDYYVVVDGFFAYTKGDFTLTVTLAD